MESILRHPWFSKILGPHGLCALDRAQEEEEAEEAVAGVAERDVEEDQNLTVGATSHTMAAKRCVWLSSLKGMRPKMSRRIW